MKFDILNYITEKGKEYMVFIIVIFRIIVRAEHVYEQRRLPSSLTPARMHQKEKINKLFECFWHIVFHYFNNCLLFVYEEPLGKNGELWDTSKFPWTFRTKLIILQKQKTFIVLSQYRRMFTYCCPSSSWFGLRDWKKMVPNIFEWIFGFAFFHITFWKNKLNKYNVYNYNHCVSIIIVEPLHLVWHPSKCVPNFPIFP